MQVEPFDVETATQNYIDSLGPEALEKAANYTLGNHWLLLAELGVSAIVTWLILRMGLLQSIERKFGKHSTIGIFLIGVVYSFISALLSLPWGLYSGWWRETSYERTSQPIGDFLSQAALANLIGAFALSIFLVFIYFLIRRAGRLWWIWAGGLTAMFTAVFMLLAPVYLLPLFNEYKPLPEGPVRDALEVMAADANIPAEKIFVYDGSRQSNNFTANVAGIGSAARIAISDVALKDASLDEVKAVTGHEIGHYVLGHVWRTVIVTSILSILLFLLADLSFGFFAATFGSSRTIADPSSLPVLIFVVSLFSLFGQPITNTLTRIGEKEADAYSLRTVNLPDALASALVKTAEYRNPRPSRLQEIIFYTHPSVESRVRAAMEWKAEYPPTAP